MRLLFPEPPKPDQLGLMDSYIQTINISKTKGPDSDRYTVSNMIGMHSFTSLEGAASLFSATVLIN